jgi:ABC-2 type transport system ATP-binding protein
MLSVNNISKKLGENQVLKNCNLEVEAGTILGLVGINGAGKSTMLRCIAGIYQCDQGDVFVDGENVYENNKIKKEIFLIDDNPYYDHNATINDLKEFYKTFYQFDEDTFVKYLRLFKLNATKSINNFSKGMKRQVFILMALAIKPKILMLDEAFDGLDPLVRLTLKRALIEQIEESNITVIISSHNLRELEDICDKFALIENHEIDTEGNIGDSKDNIHKVQLAFTENIDIEKFEELNVITSSTEGRVISIVVEGEIDKITTYLNKYNPVIMDVLDVSFEELFIYELIKKGYSTYE